MGAEIILLYRPRILWIEHSFLVLLPLRQSPVLSAHLANATPIHSSTTLKQREMILCPIKGRYVGQAPSQTEQALFVSCPGFAVMLP
jgi:hypothetical protein